MHERRDFKREPYSRCSYVPEPGSGHTAARPSHRGQWEYTHREQKPWTGPAVLERKPGAVQVGWDTAEPGPVPSRSMWYWQTGSSEGHTVPVESKAPEEAEQAAGPGEVVAGLEPGPELELALGPVVAAIHPRPATQPESTTVVEG